MHKLIKVFFVDFEVNKKITKNFLKALKGTAVALKLNDINSFHDLNKHSRNRNNNRPKEEPAILGPGLVVSPGGNIYANRYN